ncbi:ferredoxin [Streptomyces sp. MS2.AVA.5]|uniref:Ferredoxin n=1 Tax=Streptomyces achmelvichensis TaxID=3134111 RepID=A0ACC6Q0C2_9ACTN
MTDAAPPGRLPLDGRFHIDDTCIDCHLCRDLAPDNFESDDENEIHYVCKQPEDESELEGVLDAYESCPSNSIRYLRISTEE